MYNQIMSIDPGTTKSAFVLYNGSRLIEKGIIGNDELLMKISLDENVYYGFIEMIASYGMPVGKDVFETCKWIGKFEYAFHLSNIATSMVYRKDVKMHLCGSTRAKDSNIRAALIDIYGKPGTKKEPNEFYQDSEIKVSKDIWAALAVLHYGKDLLAGKVSL